MPRLHLALVFVSGGILVLGCLGFSVLGCLGFRGLRAVGFLGLKDLINRYLCPG